MQFELEQLKAQNQKLEALIKQQFGMMSVLNEVGGVLSQHIIDQATAPNKDELSSQAWKFRFYDLFEKLIAQQTPNRLVETTSFQRFSDLVQLLKTGKLRDEDMRSSMISRKPNYHSNSVTDLANDRQQT